MQAKENGVAHHLSIRRITPTEAQKMLDGNKWHNRPINIKYVERYAKDMKAGKWMMNGDTITLSPNGNVLDGQHRLHAIIKSNTAVPSVVIEGVDEDTFPTKDNGKLRSAADVMSIVGYLNYSVLASVARWYLYITKEAPMQVQVTNHRVLECVQDHPHLPHWASLHHGIRADKVFPSACTAVFALMDEVYGRDIAEDFFRKSVSGVNLNKGNPAYELRERLLASKGRTTKLSTIAQVALTIKAANAYVKGSKMGLLRWGGDEDFPTLIESALL